MSCKAVYAQLNNLYIRKSRRKRPVFASKIHYVYLPASTTWLKHQVQKVLFMNMKPIAMIVVTAIDLILWENNYKSEYQARELSFLCYRL